MFQYCFKQIMLLLGKMLRLEFVALGVLVFSSFLSSSSGQRPSCSAPVPVAARIRCNGATREADCPTSCCFDNSNPSEVIAIRCYANSQSSEAAQMLSVASRSLPRIEPPTSGEAESTLSATARTLSGRGLNPESAASASARIEQRNFLSLLIDFPECAVPTPFCHRARCNFQNPRAESDPIQCLTDPSCCFDRDLFLYKAVFGQQFMGGAPVCYYGPTSSRYRFIAGTIRPWNPFFQDTIVDIFEDVFDNTILNLQTQAICRLTNALGNSFFQAAKCGWEGITRLQCHLKGCCFDDDSEECSYPTEVFGAQNNEIYPELVAQSPEETTCQQPTAFTPQVFGRLPCRCNTENASLISLIATCSFQSDCCPNYLAYFPELLDLSLISGGFQASSLSFNAPSSVGGFGGSQFPGLGGSQFPGLGGSLFPGLGGSLFPGFGGSPFPGFGGGSGGINPIILASVLPNFDISTISSFYCPYFFFPFPGFPDLTESVLNCCKQQPCYHRKRGGFTPPPPRASWAEWSQFGPCSGDPCNGQRVRQRSCVAFGNQPSNGCQGSGSESESCTTPQCCSWSNWGQWQNCNGPCGGRGSQARTRRCPCPPGQFGRTCPGSASSTRQCQVPSCPATWSQWTVTGPCNAPCGGIGNQARQRACRQPNGFPSNSCPGSDRDQITCNGPPCPASWSQWSAYGNCNAPCGRSGSQTRNRQCRRPNGAPANSCPGQGSQTRGCQGPPCPATWTQWSAYRPCDASCGQNGRQARNRQCRRPNGAPANSCPGQGSQTRGCQGPPCPATWTQWSAYGPCDASCGQNGRQTRNRQCRRPNGAPANSCPGQGSQTRGCQGPPCPATWTQWSAYGPCDASCGQNGRQTRNRQCRRPNGAPANSCPGQSTQTRNCQGRPCPGQWTLWSPYGNCNAACGASGVQTRTRQCRRPNGQPVNTCPGQSSQDRPCQGISCYAYSDWSPYSPCMSTCRRERRRFCEDTRSNRRVEDSNCGGSAPPVERNACSDGTCLPTPPEGWVVWGNWMEWSFCSQICGGGRRRRERMCLYRNRINSPVDSALCTCAYNSDPGSNQDGPCNTQSCNQPTYSWAEWSNWSNCNARCQGTRTRARRCTSGSQQGSSTLCPGPDTQTENCGLPAGNCATVSPGLTYTAWSSWTTVCTCPAGTFRRVRCPIVASGRCDNPQFEFRNCPPGSCPPRG